MSSTFSVEETGIFKVEKTGLKDLERLKPFNDIELRMLAGDEVIEEVVFTKLWDEPVEKDGEKHLFGQFRVKSAVKDASPMYSMAVVDYTERVLYVSSKEYHHRALSISQYIRDLEGVEDLMLIEVMAFPKVILNRGYLKKEA